MNLADTRYVISDTETFGLNPARDSIIEVGFLIVTLDFRVVSRFETLVWSPLHDQEKEVLFRKADGGDKGSKIVRDMHTKSGLWPAAKSRGIPPWEVERLTVEWLEENGVTGEDPLVGSTIDFDRGMFRAQMPEVDRHFHYRSINVSSIKELCRRNNPTLYSKLNVAIKPKKLHRVSPDCLDTADELRFYVDNFFFTEV